MANNGLDILKITYDRVGRTRKRGTWYLGSRGFEFHCPGCNGGRVILDVLKLVNLDGRCRVLCKCGFDRNVQFADFPPTVDSSVRS